MSSEVEEVIESPTTHPSWPSLYNPHSELFNIQHHSPIQPGGVYLTDASDVFRFTLYWTLIFYIPIFVVFGLYAFFNLTFPPSRKDTQSWSRHRLDNSGEERQVTIPLQPLTPRHSSNLNFLSTSANIGNRYQSLRSDIVPPGGTPPQSPLTPHSPPALRPTKKQNEGRSRVTFALLVLFGFLLMSLVGAVLSSAILGFVLTGLYKAGKFYISTWVPFLWALIHVLVGMLNVWPSVIDFI